MLVKTRLELNDLQNLQTPEDIADLFKKLGHDASAQPLAVDALELTLPNAKAIRQAYLIANYECRNTTFQILLVQLNKKEFEFYSIAKNRIKLIASNLCNRPSNYLLIATENYKQLLLLIPNKKLDSDLNLVINFEFCIIDLINPSYQERNWLEKLAFKGELPQKLLEVYQNNLRTIYSTQKALAEKHQEDSVRTYLINAGRFQLLTTHEEIELARKAAKFMELEKVRQQLRKQLRREPTHQEWAVTAGISLLEHRNILKARDKLIDANLRLVVSIAKQYQGRGVDLLDLIQEGNIGLIQSAEKFDPERGCRFSTYATWWIRQRCIRAIAKQSRTIRLPVHLYEKISNLKKTSRLLTQNLGRKPTEKELANSLDTTVKHIQAIVQFARPVMSLDISIGEENSCLGQFIESSFATPEEQAFSKHLLQDIKKLLNVLSSREQYVLKLRYGLNDEEEKSLAEIGRSLNLTRERIRQIEEKALKQLRMPNNRNLIKEYLY